jgi:hypothetical protein
VILGSHPGLGALEVPVCSESMIHMDHCRSHADECYEKVAKPNIPALLQARQRGIDT